MFVGLCPRGRRGLTQHTAVFLFFPAIFLAFAAKSEKFSGYQHTPIPKNRQLWMAKRRNSRQNPFWKGHDALSKFLKDQSFLCRRLKARTRVIPEEVCNIFSPFPWPLHEQCGLQQRKKAKPTTKKQPCMPLKKMGSLHG